LPFLARRADAFIFTLGEKTCRMCFVEAIIRLRLFHSLYYAVSISFLQMVVFLYYGEKKKKALLPPSEMMKKFKRE